MEELLKNIFDVIVTKHGNACVIVEEMPEFRYKKTEKRLYAESRGFASELRYERPDAKWQAFGGRTIHFKLEDGSIEVGTGQWWDHPPSGSWTRVGVSTLKELSECYVFMGGFIKTELLEAWLKENIAQTDYYFYDSKRKGGTYATN